ncbi:hypothetical protein Shyd_47820 [Streptomyces hydrogenans]|uniref:Uncharacterized protein n=1 Tax=Streptomyces hydrogenans TaxID=1873719 RepID=A0ABQ3PEG9_9ACTN|nr:hypothetical protein [Streptomyces hydrogenans]GHI23411.1 hypothetical protein Shyd_47820 [Streptomyces hydrogenans]
MAWDEWNQLKAEASGTSSTRMQLNRVPDEPDGKTLSTNSQGDLKVVNEHLSKIGDHAFGLYNRLWREGRVAEATTDSAASDLSGQGFDLGGALSHVSLKWASALADLMDACAHISNHMDYTKNAHAGDEIFIERAHEQHRHARRAASTSGRPNRASRTTSSTATRKTRATRRTASDGLRTPCCTPSSARWTPR